jgi:hypothetical protein
MSCSLIALNTSIVLCKEIIWVRHHFKLQIVSGRVLKEHCPLLTRLALESLMWLDDEFRAMCLQSLPQFHKLGLCQDSSKVRYWHLISIHWVVVVDAAVLFTYIVANNLVTVQAVVLPLVLGPAPFFQLEYAAIELQAGIIN